MKRLPVLLFAIVLILTVFPIGSTVNAASVITFSGEELPNIQQIYDEWSYDEVVMLTIDKGEDYDTVATFMQEGGIPSR
jgi:hypothetical protein